MQKLTNCNLIIHFKSFLFGLPIFLKESFAALIKMLFVSFKISLLDSRNPEAQNNMNSPQNMFCLCFYCWSPWLLWTRPQAYIVVEEPCWKSVVSLLRSMHLPLSWNPKHTCLEASPTEINGFWGFWVLIYVWFSQKQRFVHHILRCW